MGFKQLEKLINSISGYDNRLQFITNSTTVGWYRGNNAKADYYFWIDPPWRIIKSNSIIINSYNYPYHENYTDDESEKEAQDFHEWASQAGFLTWEKVSKVSFSELGDLKIVWANKCQMDVFVNSTEDSSYHFYDNVAGIHYEIYPGKIEIRKIERRNLREIY